MFARSMTQACQLVSTFRRAPAGRPGLIRGAKVNNDSRKGLVPYQSVDQLPRVRILTDTTAADVSSGHGHSDQLVGSGRP